MHTEYAEYEAHEIYSAWTGNNINDNHHYSAIFYVLSTGILSECEQGPLYIFAICSNITYRFQCTEHFVIDTLLTKIHNICTKCRHPTSANMSKCQF